jgi:hypothetical protein
MVSLCRKIGSRGLLLASGQSFLRRKGFLSNDSACPRFLDKAKAWTNILFNFPEQHEKLKTIGI